MAIDGTLKTVTTQVLPIYEKALTGLDAFNNHWL